VGEVVERIEAGLRIGVRVQRQQRQGGDDEVIAVGFRMGDELKGDAAARPGPRLDEELLAEGGGELVGREPRQDIGGAARRKPLRSAPAGSATRPRGSRPAPVRRRTMRPPAACCETASRAVSRDERSWDDLGPKCLRLLRIVP
jgi:ribosomal protein S6E (S10)